MDAGQGVQRQSLHVVKTARPCHDGRFSLGWAPASSCSKQHLVLSPVVPFKEPLCRFQASRFRGLDFVESPWGWVLRKFLAMVVTNVS